MNILIAGASGFIGQALVKSLVPDHQITVLGRDKTRLTSIFTQPGIQCCTWSELSSIEASTYEVVFNLCGDNIAAKRWDKARKQQIIQSRVHTNHLLIEWLLSQNAKPYYICANAIGIYGTQAHDDSQYFDETTPLNDKAPHDFLAEVGLAWQHSLNPAIDAGLSVTTLRFGVVLGKSGGMLQKLYWPFFCGAGAILGDGRQTISWVHLDDVVRACHFLLNQPVWLTGPVNLTAPHPVTQRYFAKTLAQTLKRPLLLILPARLIQIGLGEMGDLLLLKGSKVLPKRLLENHFVFNYPELEQALESFYH